MIDRLPPFLVELLGACPRAGEGVHAWLFKVARQLHAHLPAIEIMRLLESRVANCGRCGSAKRDCRSGSKFDLVRVATRRPWRDQFIDSGTEMAGRKPGTARSDHSRRRRACRLSGKLRRFASRLTTRTPKR